MSDAVVPDTHAGQPGILRCVTCGRRVPQTDQQAAMKADCSAKDKGWKCTFIFDKWVAAAKAGTGMSRFPKSAASVTKRYAKEIAALED